VAGYIKKLSYSKRFRWIVAVILPFLLVALVLGTIVALRWVAAQHLVGQTPPAATKTASAPPSPTPALPSAEQVAAAPHPPIEASANPPATETGRAVVEEEPTANLPVTEPPPPAPDPLEKVTVAPLPQDQQAASATAPEPAAPDTKAVPAPAAATAPAPEPPAAAGRAKPAWQRLAVAAPATGGRPMIAVIIDDMGLDRHRSQEIIDLPGPLTISFMSYAGDMAHQEAEAKAHGHEIMMHVPMEPLDGHLDPGPGVLTDKLSSAEIRKTLDADLAKFGGYVGINNHMGSKFTANARGMEVVMQDLRERGLLFIDSLTSDKSVGWAMARRYGVPTAARNVFLDDSSDLAAVEKQLAKLEEVARHKGTAIAIGHPRDATIKALAAWLPKLSAKGLVLVPVTAVVRARMDENQKTALTGH
jgi:polysaccharide deacetylase 2 family uncharacterized protein YibQ